MTSYYQAASLSSKSSWYNADLWGRLQADDSPRLRLAVNQHISSQKRGLSSPSEYAQDRREAFFSDRKTQDAVIRNLEIIGEAARSVPLAFQAAHLDLPWRQAMALHNVLIHEYFGVDVRTVWGVVDKELPDLKRRVTQILVELPDSDQRKLD